MPKIQEVFKFLISSSHTSNKNMTSEFKKKKRGWLNPYNHHTAFGKKVQMLLSF